jgi:hypothetical protein
MKSVMTRKARLLMLVTGLAVAAASEVAAQTPSEPAKQAFLNVNVGAQPAIRSIASSSSFQLHDETATVTTSQGIGNGAIFDINGGYRVWQNLAIGIGYSTLFSNPYDNTLVASIPDPLFFNRPKTVTVVTTGLEHSEKTVYLQAVWIVPVTDKIDVALSAGPSFIRVRQELVLPSSVTIPVGTQNVNVATSVEERTAKGVNLGFDGTYLFTKRVGAGIFARYSGGSVDIPGAEGLKVGGFQTGLGIRVRF